MGLLAAIGTIAPLLGLLGTVTGIITLFNVITEVGTNDARVLAGGISEAGNSSVEVAVPIDVLQNKALKNSITDTQELSFIEQAKAFFKKGGIVMYPLMLVAIFALLLSLERFIVLTLRGRIRKQMMNRFFRKLFESRAFQTRSSRFMVDDS